MVHGFMKYLLPLLLAAVIFTLVWVWIADPFAPESRTAEPEATLAPAVTVPAQTEAPQTEPAETDPTQPTETEPQEERFLLTFVGDCTLGASPSNYYARLGFINTVGDDRKYPFANMISYFENDDFTLLNLEGPLCDEGYPSEKKHTFRGPTEYIEILTENSVEAVTLANNHTLDYGKSGYDSTTSLLDSVQIPYVERDSSRIVTTESGLTIGLYGAVYYKLDTADMVEEITTMKEQGVDLIVVLPHWGAEGCYQPTQEQIDVGRAAIDAGAHIVCGSHPHVLQPIEEYNGGIIYYSLGNFSFGGNAAPLDLDTALLQQEIIRRADGSVVLGELTIVPACVSSDPKLNNYQPTPYPEGSEEYQRVMEKLTGSFTGPNLKIS